jgi:outer membrane protein TolC
LNATLAGGGGTIAAFALICGFGAGCYAPTRSSREARLEEFRRTEVSQPEAEKSGPLSLAAALERALERSPTLAALRAKKQAAAAAVDAATKLDNPELRVGGVQLDQVANGVPRANVRLRVKPPRPFENEARRAEAEALIRETEAELQAASTEVRAEVRERFFELQLSREEVTSSAELLSARSRFTAALNQQVQDGRRTAVELANAQVAQQEAEFLALAANERSARARLELAALLGLDAESLELEATEPLAELPGAAECSNQALQQAAGIEQRLARIDAAEAVLDREQAQQVPWLSFLDVGYAFAPGTDDPLGFFFGGGITLPIFDTNADAVEASRAEVAYAERELNAEFDRVQRAVRSAHRSAESAQRLWQSYRSKTPVAAALAVEAAQRAVESGTLAELSALEAAVKLAQVRMTEADLRRRAVEAVLELDELTDCQRRSAVRSSAQPRKNR